MNKILVIFLTLIALGSVGVGCSTDCGDSDVNVPILSPTQENTLDNQNNNVNAQEQSQETEVANNNTNTNNNNNSASSSSNNYVNVKNDNYISNNIYIKSINKIHDITASSRNTNHQWQGTEVEQANVQKVYAKGTTVFVPGSCPMVMATVPNNNNNSSAAAGGENVGMQETGFNFTSLLMGIIGVMGGLLATRFRSL